MIDIFSYQQNFLDENNNEAWIHKKIYFFLDVTDMWHVDFENEWAVQAEIASPKVTTI